MGAGSGDNSLVFGARTGHTRGKQFLLGPIGSWEGLCTRRDKPLLSEAYALHQGAPAFFRILGAPFRWDPPLLPPFGNTICLHFGGPMFVHSGAWVPGRASWVSGGGRPSAAPSQKSVSLLFSPCAPPPPQWPRKGLRKEVPPSVPCLDTGYIMCHLPPACVRRDGSTSRTRRVRKARLVCSWARVQGFVSPRKFLAYLSGCSLFCATFVPCFDRGMPPTYFAPTLQPGRVPFTASPLLPRVYEIGPVFRAENSNTHRHLTEFVGLDLEMTIFEHYYEVLDVAEELFAHIFTQLNAQCKPFLEMVREQHPFEDLEFQVKTSLSLHPRWPLDCLSGRIPEHMCNDAVVL